MTNECSAGSARSTASVSIPALRPPHWFWVWDVALAAIAGLLARVVISADRAGIDAGFGSLFAAGVIATLCALWSMMRVGIASKALGANVMLRSELVLSGQSASAVIWHSIWRRLLSSLLPFAVSVPACLASATFHMTLNGHTGGSSWSVALLVVETMLLTGIALLPTVTALGAAFRWLAVSCRGTSCTLPEMLGALSATAAVLVGAVLVAFYPLTLIILPLSVWLLASSWKAACKALYEFD